MFELVVLCWLAGAALGQTNELQLETVADIQMNAIDSAQYTFTVKEKTITTGLYFFALPCVGRFDLYLNKGAAASKDAKIGQLLWKDGKDTTFTFLSVPMAPLDTVFYVQLHAYDQAVNSTLFGSARIVVSLDKDFVTKNALPLKDSTLRGEVTKDKTQVTVTFTKADPVAGATDEYEVFTKSGKIGTDPVKEPLNGCSLPTLMDRVAAPNLTAAADGGANMVSYTLNNTYQKDDDAPFSTAVRLCRKPANGGYTWCAAYQVLSVCEGATCAATGRSAAAPLSHAPALAIALLAAAAAALLAYN